MFTSSWQPNQAQADVHSAFDAELDRADAYVAEVTLLWGDSTLSVRHVREGSTLTIGGDGADLLIARFEGAEPVRVAHGAAGVTVTPSSDATVNFDGWPRDTVAFDLGAGHHAELLVGAFTIRLRVVPEAKVAALAWMDRVREGALGSVGVSFLVHASIVAALAFFMPSLGGDDSEAIDRDRMFAMKALIDNAAEREREREDEPAVEPTDANQGEASGGGRAMNAEGAMGKTDAHTQGHYAAKGNARPEDATLSRADLVRQAKEFGMTELLGALNSQMAATNAPVVPWDSVQNGADNVDFRGNLFSQNLDDAVGMGGLGLSGTEEGGGGNNVGIGIRDIGGLGRSLDGRLGSGNCMAPPCQGVGVGHLPGGHAPKGPRMRVAKTEIEGGRLPSEVIQRIVRMSHGRFRNCYEAGLRTNPSLAGRIAVRFVIGRDGAVSLANEGDSDMPDESVRKCVVQTFYSLSFPSPENGAVRVTYPLIFSPSE